MAIAMPDEQNLPPGPLRQLVEGLHQLYGEAGRPGTRTLSRTIKANNDLGAVVSHETIAAMLHGKGTPSWARLEACVRQLAAMSPRRPDPDATVLRFHDLWCAIPVPTPVPDIPAAPPLLSPMETLQSLGDDVDDIEPFQDLAAMERELQAIEKRHGGPSRQEMGPDYTAVVAERNTLDLRVRRLEDQLKEFAAEYMIPAKDLRRALGPVWHRAIQLSDRGPILADLMGQGENQLVPTALLIDVIRILASEVEVPSRHVKLARARRRQGELEW